MNTHKNSERFYLSRFKELCPEFPAGSIVDSESPDFLVHSPYGTVGIELTAVYRPDPIVMKKKKTFSLQAIEKEREKIVDRIKNYYIDIGGCSLHASFLFSGNAIDKNSIKDKKLEAIAGLIKEYQPDIGTTVYFPECLKSDHNFPDWLDRVLISALNQDEENFWTAQKFAKIPKLSSIEVQKAINKKEEKFNSYQEKCPFAWLVLMSHVGASLGTHIQFLPHVWNHRYETLFEQVWIFQYPNSARKLEVVKDNSKQGKL